ncbi:MarR family winged helix-turn-helix transcriptional regulator [Cupriavidus necator]
MRVFIPLIFAGLDIQLPGIALNNKENLMSGSGRTFFYIQQLEQLIRRQLDECLQTIGITAGQYMIFNLIAHLEPVSSASLARRTMITAQSMGEYIRVLEAKGLIKRQSSKVNKRTILISSTAAGRKTLVQCESKIDEVEREFFSCLSGEDLTHLRLLVSRVRSAQLAKRDKELETSDAQSL